MNLDENVLENVVDVGVVPGMLAHKIFQSISERIPEFFSSARAGFVSCQCLSLHRILRVRLCIGRRKVWLLGDRALRWRLLYDGAVEERRQIDELARGDAALDLFALPDRLDQPCAVELLDVV